MLILRIIAFVSVFIVAAMAWYKRDTLTKESKNHLIVYVVSAILLTAIFGLGNKIVASALPFYSVIVILLVLNSQRAKNTQKEKAIRFLAETTVKLQEEVDRIIEEREEE